MNTMTIYAVVDRFEGDLALVLLGESGHAVNWPVKYLPDGISEGSVLVVSVREDSEAASNFKADIDYLIDQLSSGE